ncbi:hypothetical protein Pan241w_07180 [Gimesia alba]|uniref:Non-specific serine/threonine protein kinase n=1 Tax=Gimesia alba TaxID=2527973 RepID=A0A517R9U8_9PLAN|nr:lipopolysaccharide kinase InaA family protein [Gimesia alba]QDT40660.1 hypothetical protein Pan241w_07180 [Gimesia alba]
MKLSDFHREEHFRFKLFDDSATYTTIRCLKEEDLRSVWLIDIPERGLTTLKRWPISWKLRWKSLFKQSQPQRQISGAWKLLTAGINTPQPVTPVYRAGDFFQLEMPFIEGATVFDLLNSGESYSHAEQCLIARELGEIVRKLASTHLRHRDLKLENVVVKPANQVQQKPTLWLIDPVGIRNCLSPLTAIVYMLDRLAIQPIHERIPLPTSLQIICIRSAVNSIPRRQRKLLFQKLRKQLQSSTRETGPLND